MTPRSTPTSAPPMPDAPATLSDDVIVGETTGQRLHYNAFAHWLARFAPARTPESDTDALPLSVPNAVGATDAARA